MRTPPRHVIVPTDFQDDLSGAVEVAVELAADPGRVHVLHVLAVHAADEPGLLRNVLDEATRRDHVLERMRRELDRPGLTEVGLAVGFGNPGERIVQFARDLAAELIVIPSHSERGLSRWLLGSVAERVVRLAGCPVLILKSERS
jgi:nucleotide-binding universal stress UspA family protein